jgi:hypothetical protein
MTLQELQHLFRFQTTATEDYTPSKEIEFTVIKERDRKTVKHPVDKLEELIPSLDGLMFEGYNDKTPIFIKPEA